jgi:hypothetical protein
MDTPAPPLAPVPGWGCIHCDARFADYAECRAHERACPRPPLESFFANNQASTSPFCMRAVADEVAAIGNGSGQKKITSYFTVQPT